MTDSGRTVYGGGGITPDEMFEIPKGNKLQAMMIRSYAFLNFTATWLAARDRKTITKEWAPDEGVVQEFRQFALKQNIPFTEAEFTENLDWIKQQIRREVFINVYNIEDSRKMSISSDPMVLKAIDALPKAKALLENAKKMIVQRMAPRRD